MKNCLPVVLLIWLLENNLTAQKLMQVPDSLSAICKPVNVAWKIGLKKTQYSFGAYQLSSYKTGKSSWKSDGVGFSLFPKEAVDQVSEKASFVFTSAANDTAYVDIGVLSSLSYEDARNSVFYKGEKTYKGGVQIFTALIRLNHDTAAWTLMLQRSETETIVTIEKPMKGQLTSAGKTFNLVPVKKYDDGKTALIGTIGFLFEQNNQPVAGIQFAGLPLKIQQQSFVWIPDNMDDRLKFVFATASTAIMLRMHQTSGSTIGDAAPPQF